MGYVKGDAREPYCVHSSPGQEQPASACSLCKNGPDLAAWKAYWAEHQDSIPARYRQSTEDGKMFNTGKEHYQSDIVLGQRYRDTQTGIEGVATALYFFQHACERALLEFVVEGKIEENSFDSPRLVHVETGKQATTERTGGPSRERQVRPTGGQR